MSETHVTIERACGISGFTKQHIERLCAKGVLTYVEKQGARLIELASLEKYSERKQTPQTLTLKKVKTKDVSEESIIISGEKFVSTNRAARLAGYTEEEVLTLASTGKIPKKYFGERLFVRLEALFEYRRSAHTPPATQAQAKKPDIVRLVRPKTPPPPYVPVRYESVPNKNFLPSIPEKVVIKRVEVPREPRYSEKERLAYTERRNRTPHRTVTKDTVFMQQPTQVKKSIGLLRLSIYGVLATLVILGVFFAYLLFSYSSRDIEQSSLFGPILRASTGTIQYYSR